ncbi:MAG: Diacetylchitobiose deacetylase [Candidatus Heimdallarchaeota archaeon LC_2]|nr:MAG: Diacetylchitobiose deacetylase [Candidatus Heimdallarchaeota archaeon LC_2]
MKTETDKKTVLAIFAHADDELGCVGTLANYADDGHNVYLAFLTKGENSTTVEGNSEEVVRKRKIHTEKIENLIGVKVKYLDFEDSNIAYTVENGYKVAELIKEIQPHIIITWGKYESVGGGHPDHRNCADLVRDATSYARYKRNGSNFPPHRERIDFYTYVDFTSNNNTRLKFIDVTHQQDRIKDFIDIYIEAYGDWPVGDFKQSSMVQNGLLAGVKFAEVFRLVMRGSSVGKLFT